MIKLHGSIDWYDREPYDAARQYFKTAGATVPDRDPIFGPDPTVQTESLARGAVRGELARQLVERVRRVRDHRRVFPIAPYWEAVPFLLPPAHDKLLGHDPIRALWQNLHRAFAACSAIVIVGYSMPSYDGYAYEALGRLLIEFQAGGPTTYFGHRRLPLQLITLTDSDSAALQTLPFVCASKTRVWKDGLSAEALDWIDWGDEDRPGR